MPAKYVFSIEKYCKGVFFLATIGTLLSAYLIYLHYQPEASTVCMLSETFNCDVVNKSAYSKLFGIPVAVLGTIFYASMAIFTGLFVFKNDLFKGIDIKDIFRGVFLITLSGVAFSLYLTYHEAFTLKAYCIFCVIQQFIVLLIAFCMFRINQKV